jgi:hypothetical protein
MGGGPIETAGPDLTLCTGESDIGPLHHAWEWVRWVNATRNPATRRRRVEVSNSKMNKGKRRPCCFNLSACTDPDLSRNGRLVDPH